MILYFSGSGNSLAISRQLADKIGESVMPMSKAVALDLSREKRIGLVYPCYWFNAPAAVTELIDKIQFPKDAYTFIVIPCGAQAGNSIWTIRKKLSEKGVVLSYSEKIRVPDNSAIGFGRNPNDQVWKFERYAPRLERIAKEIAADTQKLSYAWWGPIGKLCALPSIQKRTLPMLTPAVNTDKCIGCGICASVCPRNNITIANGKAHFGERCTQCLACVHFCAQQAVELNRKATPKQHQYHHPEISLKDMSH